MMNILIRDVPADIHAELQKRAERDGRSLQQYLVNELRRLTDRPTMDEVIDRIESRDGVELGFDQAVTYIAEGRAER
jgi:plasmid stability protein